LGEEKKEEAENKRKLKLITFMVNNMALPQHEEFKEFCNSRGVSYGQAIPFLLEAYNTLHGSLRIPSDSDKPKKEKERFGGEE